MAKTAKVEGKTVTIGDWVGFKSDIEQSGKIIGIEGQYLVLENVNGFSGGYIGGQTRTTERASDCWVD